jgi:hypothetical protein
MPEFLDEIPSGLDNRGCNSWGWAGSKEIVLLIRKINIFTA